jgi:hypothetical protein
VSDNIPPPPDPGPDPGSDPAPEPAPDLAPEPEFLTHQGPGPTGRRRAKTIGIAVAGVAAVVVAGGAAWGVTQLLAGGGPAPATALPADVIGYVSVDLDPSAGQKIEAIKTLNKFPALRKELGIGSGDDVRRWLVDKLQDEQSCKSLDYDTEVKPWIGDKLAVAAVPDSAHVAAPLFAVQVKDQDKAREGVKAIFTDCGESDDYGVAFVGDYMLLAENDAIAKKAAADAKLDPLSDDAAYKKLMDQAGDSGIVTGYVGKGVVDALADGMDAASLPPAQRDQIDKAVKDFHGAAAVVRFDGGGIEAEVVSDAGQTAGLTAADDITRLPKTTAGALSVGLPDGWAEKDLAKLKDQLGAATVDRAVTQIENQTGLRVPEDVETLLGHGFTIAVDGSVSTHPSDPSDIPAGLLVKGDQQDIDAVLDQVRTLVGPFGVLLQSEAGDGRVAIGVDEAYLRSLIQDGGLGNTSRFKDAVAHADKANGVLYVDFDAGGWLDRATSGLDDAEVTDNLKPLSALGVSTWTDGGVWHAEVRVGTD